MATWPISLTRFCSGPSRWPRAHEGPSAARTRRAGCARGAPSRGPAMGRSRRRAHATRRARPRPPPPARVSTAPIAPGVCGAPPSKIGQGWSAMGARPTPRRRRRTWPRSAGSCSRSGACWSVEWRRSSIREGCRRGPFDRTSNCLARRNSVHSLRGEGIRWAVVSPSPGDVAPARHLRAGPTVGTIHSHEPH